MKQRFAAANEFPVAIRTRGSARNRGFDKPCDTKKDKRVRFDDTELDSVPAYASVRERKLAQFPRSDAPKTSEYAYFISTKSGAVHGHSCSYDRDNGRSNNPKTNRHGREDVKHSNIAKSISKDHRFSDCRETAGHFDRHLLLTPRVTKYEEPGQGDINDLTKNTREKPLLPSENVTPIGRYSSLSTLKDASEHASLSGDLETNARRDIFSAKRQRLRQWAHNSISEGETPHPEGAGLISSLLGRLYHKCDVSDLFYLHGSSKGEIRNGHKAPFSCEIKNLEERLHIPHRRVRDMEHPKICCGYQDRVFLDQDAYFSGSPFTKYGTEVHFKDELSDLHIRSKDHKSRSSHVEHDLPLSLPFERYGFSSSCYLEELDEPCSPSQCQRKDHHRFLLKWEFEGEKDGVGSSITNYEPAKVYSPGLSTTWNVNHQQIVDHVPDSKALCSPSLFSNYHLQYNSTQSYPPTSYFTSNFVPSFDGANCSALNINISSLTLPTTPKCITSTEDTDAENIPYSSNMIFSFGDQLWLKNKAWDSKPHSDFWLKGSQDADFSLKNSSIFHTWQSPQSEDSLCSFSIPTEDTIHNHSWL